MVLFHQSFFSDGQKRPVDLVKFSRKALNAGLWYVFSGKPN
jgi:hypothetical protein